MPDHKKAAPARGLPKKKNSHSPLRDDIVDIDRSILRLLLKRHNIMEKMAPKGRLESAEEKYLRECWQNEVSRISRDPELSGRFFSLMQNMTFLPRPVAPGGEATTGNPPRDAYNLAPLRSPVVIDMKSPLDGRDSLLWLYLAAAAGQRIRLEPTLQNNSLMQFLKTLEDLGTKVNHGHDNIAVDAGTPLGRNDIIIHVGESSLNFYIFLAHYIGRPSRVKFTGGTRLKLADLSGLRHMLPVLGARLTSIVPKSNGLPARVECSGILPPGFDFPPDLPIQFGEALVLAASFYEKPFAINFSRHPRKDALFDRLLPILDASGSVYTLDGHTINLEPTALAIPERPLLPMAADLAAFILALAEPLRGSASLGGRWPDWPESRALWEILQNLGLNWQLGENSINAKVTAPIRSFELANVTLERLEVLSDTSIALLCSLAACAALAGGTATIPSCLPEIESALDFFHAANLEMDKNGNLHRKADTAPNPVWNAPSSGWAMALAIAACARPAKLGFRLGNPGILTELWPGFWNLYNTLPAPHQKIEKRVPETGSEETPEKTRRRILTESVAIPPEIREDD